ncbi:MAG TPA: cyclic nucleotide-binding domain-containing protein [Nodularia sp. (in: cyanobacteria)]|nr:cyclic nucleotide-binding domain-containing protein [Nodularia sp. (in: cyanobacteria)]
MKKNTSNEQSPTPAESILQLLQIIAGDTSLGSDLSQAWVIREFQPGEDLNRDSNDTDNFLYLICHGQVCLWGFDATLGREVSTQLLVGAQTFGGEHLLDHQTLPYRAIAASAGCVAQIPIFDLKQCLNRIPNLESDLQLFTYQQQALIFFKTHTKLRSVSNSTLEKLLSYLVAMKITTGSSLREATAPAQGRFWLAGGRIDNSQQIGDSWIYPDVTLSDAIAQTNVLVYYLSREHWESVKAIAPHLFPQQTNLQIIQIPLPVPGITEQPDYAKIDFPEGGNQPQSKAKLWTNYL